MPRNQLEDTPFTKLQTRAKRHGTRLTKQTETLIQNLTAKAEALSKRCLLQTKIINRLVHLAPKEEVNKLREEIDHLGDIEVHP